MSDQMTFDDYEHDWKRKHRSSIPRRQRTSSLSEYFWILFWVVVASGAAIFSAAHTIPAAELTIFKDVTNRSQLAITAFVIVELVIFGAAALRRQIPWLRWLLLGAILAALTGNVGSSIRAVYENGGDLLNQFGGILLAIIAPITAFAAGEVLHIQLDKRAAKRRQADEIYQAQLQELEAKINREYAKYVKSFTVRSEMLAPPANSVNSANGYTKLMNSRLVIREFFERHPERIQGKLDDLMNEIEQETGMKVGRTSIHNVRTEMITPPANIIANRNGNHHDD